LLGDECLSRGVFHPEGVRDAVVNHLQNRRNHTYLLLAMMVFELGQRRLAGTLSRNEFAMSPPGSVK
jgi:hypothetical protein